MNFKKFLAVGALCVATFSNSVVLAQTNDQVTQQPVMYSQNMQSEATNSIENQKVEVLNELKQILEDSMGDLTPSKLQESVMKTHEREELEKGVSLTSPFQQPYGELIRSSMGVVNKINLGDFDVKNVDFATGVGQLVSTIDLLEVIKEKDPTLQQNLSMTTPSVEAYSSAVDKAYNVIKQEEVQMLKIKEIKNSYAIEVPAKTMQHKI